MQNQKVSIDEGLLKEIATETGGRYFRAKDNESLADIYTTIDSLEKSKVEITTTIHFQDKYFPFILLAILFLMIEFVLKYLVLRKFP
jgi:Ca-activated chloride channel family protein